MFVFSAKHRGIWPVTLTCEALGVSRSSFHGWLPRSPSDRTRRQEAMTIAIRQSFLDSERTYDARRVWHDLLAAGIGCGLHAVERLMRVATAPRSIIASDGPEIAGHRHPDEARQPLVRLTHRQFDALGLRPGRRLNRQGPTRTLLITEAGA